MNGFFFSKPDILVPVKTGTSGFQLSLSSSSDAFLAYSHQIQSFISLPLIPLELSTNGLFIELKRLGFIREVTNDIIAETVRSSVLRSAELIELLRWICSNDGIDDRGSFINSIFASIRFRDQEDSPTITLKKVQFFEQTNVLSILPSPKNVLPAKITTHLSPENLRKDLSLRAVSINGLLNFYFHEDQAYILTNRNMIECLFNLISRHWSEIGSTKRKTMKKILSSIKCVPTRKGMQLPRESYIPSSILSSDIPIIVLNVVSRMSVHNDDVIRANNQQENEVNQTPHACVLEEFLRFIGCRTIHIQSFCEGQQGLSNTSELLKANFHIFMKHLIEASATMSDEDIKELKRTKCFVGK